MRNPVTPQEGDAWCCIEPSYSREPGAQDFKVYFLIKKTFTAQISHGWKCFVTSSHGHFKIEVVDVRAVDSWFASDKYIKSHEALR